MGRSLLRRVAQAGLALALIAAFPGGAGAQISATDVAATPVSPGTSAPSGLQVPSVRPIEPAGLPEVRQARGPVALAAAVGAQPPAQPSPDEAPRESGSRVRPYLTAMLPLGVDVRVTASIVVGFSQPMSRSSVERTLVIQPQVAGTPTWQDDFTLSFKPLRVLAHGTTYEVTVSGRSVRGALVTGARRWSFTTNASPPVAISPGAGTVKVPILMYHYIRINPNPSDRLGYALSVTPGDFASQMDWLAVSGYHTITFRELEAFLNGGAGLPSRPVILTFDDGYADFYTTAMPILLSHDFRAVDYVVSGFVGWPGYMTAAQVEEADRAGMEIGSHTVDHVNLTRMSAAAVAYQVTASKLALERLLGHPVLSFCYPSGKFNWAVAAAVQAAGYDDATTTQLGWVRTLAGRYTWGRLRISGGENMSTFEADLVRIT